MALNLLPFVQLREFDNNGKLLDSGIMYFWEAGTNTPQSTYQDAAGTILNTNPVILDGAGSAKIFLQPKAYHIQIQDHTGAIIYDIDGVNGGSGSGSSSGAGSYIILDNYNALRNLDIDYDLVYLLGREFEMDGGQGFFQLDTISTNGDDDGIELVRQNTSHYKRQFADYISPLWFGCAYDSAVDNKIGLGLSFDASIQYGYDVLISGNLALGSNIEIKSGASLRLNGSIYGLGTQDIDIRFREGSKLVSCSEGGFGILTQPIFEKSVCNSLSLSWFSGNYGQVSKSSAENYRLDIDKTITIGFDVNIPVNFEVDFVGGSYINVTTTRNINIENCVYNGVGQIIKYSLKSNIGEVKVGNSYCYLEWFGGQSSISTDIDNSIPFTAALKHGNIYLISDSDKTYSITTSGTYIGGDVTIRGNYIPNNNTQSDKVPSMLFIGSDVTITVADMTLSNIKLFGAGTINANKTIIQDTIIASTVETNVGTTYKLNDVIFFGGQYVAVGANGKIVYSVDGNTWLASSLSTVEQINAIARTSKYWIAGGTNGKMWSSINGKDWVEVSTGVFNSINNIKWLNNRLVAACSNGVILYSVDGENWNSSLTSGNTFVSITYHNNLYIAVGLTGNIYKSSDLLTWTSIVVTGISTTTLYDIDTDGVIATIVGQNGTILTSTDGTTWRQRIGATSSNIVSIRYEERTRLWIATGSSQILTSNDSIVWKKLSLPVGFSQVVYDFTVNGGVYIFVCGNGQVLKTSDLNQFELKTTLNTLNLYSVDNVDTKFVSIADNGKVFESKDSITWSEQSLSNNTTSLKRIKQLGNLYLMLGASGKYWFSYDATNWTSRSISTTASLSDIVTNVDNSLFTIIGTGGKIWTSADLTLSTPVINERTSNTTNNLNTILYDADAVVMKYIVVGNSGSILYSTDSTTWTTNNSTSNGILTTSAGSNIVFGDSGLILTSTDMKTWTRQTSNTTYNLTCGVISSAGLIVLGGSNGVILTSTDGVVWVVRNSGVSVTFNRIIHQGSNFVVAGNSGVLRKSSDAITWSSAYGFVTANDFNSIRYNNGAYIIVGSNGFCSTSSDLTTWTIRTTNTSTTLRDSAFGNGFYIIVGDSGLVIYSNNLATWNGSATNTTNNLKAVIFNSTAFIIVGDSGSILLSQNGRFFSSITTKTTNNLTNILNNGQKIYTVGQSFTMLESVDNNIWKVIAERPTSDIKSGVFDSISNLYTITTKDNVYNSFDGMVWNKVDVSYTGFDKVSRVNGQYFVYNSSDSNVTETNVLTSISATTWDKLDWSGTFNNLDYGVVNSVGNYVFASNDGKVLNVQNLNGMSIRATTLSVYNSILGTTIENTIAGTISNVDGVSISIMGLTTDSTFTNFDGALSDNVSRSNITTSTSIKIQNDLTISDSTITQTKIGYEVFEVGVMVNSLNLNNNQIDNNSAALVYSENEGLTININGGVLFDGNGVGLSNGYSEIYTNNVFDNSGNKVENITAKSIDGKLLEVESFGSNLVISNSLTNWFHSQKTNLTIEDNQITTSVDILIAKDVKNTNTLRYRFGDSVSRFIKNFGGRIGFELTLPAGYDKQKQSEIRLEAKLYIPTYQITLYDYSNIEGIAYNNDEYKVGKCRVVGSIKDGAKIRNYSNIWSGRADLMAGDHVLDSGKNANNFVHMEDVFGDRDFIIPTYSKFDPISGTYYYSDYRFGHDFESFGYTTLEGDNTFEAYITINSKDRDVVLPAGSKIKVTLLPELPKDRDVLDIFYNKPTNSLDTLSGIEKVYVDFIDNKTKTLELEMLKVDGSKTIDEQKYLSLTTYPDNSTGTSIQYYIPGSYIWVVGNVRFLQQFEPEKLLTGLIGNKNVNIKINNLKPNPNYAQIFGVGSLAAGNADLTGNGRWNSASLVHTTVSPIQFYMLTAGHFKHSTDSTYRIESRIEMKQYYQA